MTEPSATSSRQVWGLFLGLLLIYHINGKPLPEVDCVAAPYTAWALVQHGSPDLRPYPEACRTCKQILVVRETSDGKIVSMRPLGSSLMALPVIAPFALFGDQPLSSMNMLHLGKLTGALCVAGAAVFFFLICRRLVPTAAWPATILFALGTTLWPVASQALWMHGPATFWVTLALYLLLTMKDEGRPSVARAWFAGLALGFAVFTRPTTAFFAVASGCVGLSQRRWKTTFAMTLGGLLPVILLLLLNYQWFGHPIKGGYYNDKWGAPTPLWLGTAGLLAAPSRGLLIYSPALLLVPLGCYALFRRTEGTQSWIKGILGSWLLAAVITLLFFAQWHDWRGGWCYGPRFLAESMPVLCLLFAFAYALITPQWRWTGIALVSLSVMVHFMGIAGRRGYSNWNHRHPVHDHGKCLFSWNDTQIEAHTRAFLKKTGIVSQQ